jgi:hypothetical protein
VSELADRRQRAREAFHDTFAGEYSTTADALDATIETATRVRVTPEVLAAFGAARRVPSKTSRPIGGTPHARRIAGLIAAFRAAGFEVEE